MPYTSERKDVTYDMTGKYWDSVGKLTITPAFHTVQAIKWRQSVGLKDYATLLDSGQSAVTGLTASDQINESFAIGKVVAKRTSDLTRIEHRILPVATFSSANQLIPGTLITKAKAMAYGALNSHIMDTMSPFQGQVFAGELRETIDLLRNPFGALKLLCQELAHALLSLRRRNLRGRKLAEAISGVWLQYRFALAPLVSDIDQIIKIINEVSEKTVPNRSRFYGFGESSTSSVVNGVATGVNNVRCKESTETVLRAECFLHAGIIFNHAVLDYGSQKDKALQRFLTAEELPSTLWNLTPFSFLVDYFSNIGSIIEASSQSFADVSYISESIVRTFVKTHTKDSFYLGPSSYYQVLEKSEPAVSRLKHRSVIRTAKTSTIPPLSVSMPGRPVQYLNMAALLISLTK